MKISFMMRAMDQDSGHQAIMMGLLNSLLRLDHDNTYILLYRTKKFLGRYSKYHNVREVLVKAPHKFFWDQIAVPYAAWREGADIIYNPKFSIPLLTHCPTVMGLHEPVWWAWPDHYEWFDRNYMKIMLPIYVRKAEHLFPISQFIVDENRKYLGLPFEHVTVTYPAPKPNFKKIEEAELLQSYRKKYQLPENYIFSVTRVDHPGLEGSTSFFPGKNVDVTVSAYLKCRDRIQQKLVIAGRRVEEYLLYRGFNQIDIDEIQFLDFVPHEDLPYLLNMADLFVIPSFYESYAMALVEALACGCAVIASQTGACPEIAQDAAIFADPYDPDDFADKYFSILTNENLRKELKTKALKRANFFNYDSTAKIVLNKMKEVVEIHR